MYNKFTGTIFSILCCITIMTLSVHCNNNGINGRRLSSSSTSTRKKVSSVGMFASEATIDFVPIKAKTKHFKSRQEDTKQSQLLSQTEIANTTTNSTVSKTNHGGVVSSYQPPNRQLFYMYELEEDFWWRWPANDTDCSENGYVGHEHAEYSGMGPPILPDDGLFLTWHFSLFSSLYNRMKRSTRRTMDPDKASLFIIPYDLGLDGYLNPNNCRNRRSCSRGMVDRLTATLDKSAHFQRNKGADHVLLWSLGQYHPWPRERCDVLMKDYCALCTITCYWMDPTKADNRFVSVPFPSGYHYHDDIKNLPWDLALAPQRNLTAVYLGSTQTLNPAHTKIRRAMTAQCNTSSECHWLQIAHNSKDINIADFLSIYKRSVFCLCPPGDDPARKAVFDAIISGCIPVIFEVATIYNQYPWHIGEQAALDISVSIPGGLVRSGKLDFMSVLLSISPEVIRKKQEALTRIAPRVQYAIPPIHTLKDRYDTTPWDPPFPDGVEITLDGLFERTGRVMRNESTGIPHRLMTGREWSAEYDVVRIQVPTHGAVTDIKGAVLSVPVRNGATTFAQQTPAVSESAVVAATTTRAANTSLSEAETAASVGAPVSTVASTVTVTVSNGTHSITVTVDNSDEASLAQIASEFQRRRDRVGAANTAHSSPGSLGNNGVGGGRHHGHRGVHYKAGGGRQKHAAASGGGGHGTGVSAFGPPGEEANPALAGTGPGDLD